MGWDGMSWDELRRPDMRRTVKSWEELSWNELRRSWRSWEELKREEFRWTVERWEKLRWHEKRWEQLWSAEKSWEKERIHEMRWDEMGWRRLRWQRGAMSNSKRSCDALRRDEMRKDPTFKRDGTRMKSQQIVVAKHRRHASNLPAESLFRSIDYKCFNFEAFAFGLSGYYWQS